MDEKEFYKRTSKPADWVVKMRRFYNEHGFYRATDLRRLLGNPRLGNPRRAAIVEDIKEAGKPFLESLGNVDLI